MLSSKSLYKMSITKKFLSLTQYYTQMNPNMISGSCDVIVTRACDGTLKCTPFYVRFGKKDIFKLRDHHRVSLFVNGVCVPMAIKINKLGSIVFEKDDEEEHVQEVYEIREERYENIMKKYNIDCARLVWTKENNKVGQTNCEIDNKLEYDIDKKACKAKCNDIIKKIDKEKNEYTNENDKTSNKNNKNTIMKNNFNGATKNNCNEGLETAIKKLEIESDTKQQEELLDTNLVLNTDVEVIENVLLLNSNISPKQSSKTLKSSAKMQIQNQKPYNRNNFDIENYKLYKERLSNDGSSDFIINTKIFKQIINSKITKNVKFWLILKKCFDFEIFYNIRERYRMFRRYLLIKPPTFYEELASKQNSYKNMLNSNTHLDFLASMSKEISHLLLGIIFPQKNVKKCNFGTQDGCTNAEVTFSQCLKQKIVKNKFRCTFEEFRLRSLENTHNVVVHIKGCEKCDLEFFLLYDLFVDLFFYLRNLLVTDCKSRKTKFDAYLEKKINERRSYSLFRKVHKRPESQISIQMSDSQLKRLNLIEGRNELVFKVDGTSQHISIDCYLWNDTDRIIISDIDGTITKSDAWGHVCAFIGKDWTHYGIAELFTRIEKNKYRFIYLSSRPIEQIAITKKYLHNIYQDGYKLPKGPILLSPNGIFGAIYTELILRKPERFKIACLKNVKSLFVENPFFSGFGNRKTDIITYKTVGITTNKIYTVDHKGRVLLEYARSKTGSFMSLNAIVDNIFPAFSNSIQHEIHDWW